MLNILTIDLEEYYHVGRPGEGPSARDLPGLPSRIECDVQRVLEMLDDHGARATFFVLGEVAAAHPRVVSRLLEAGHEIASHGYRHTPVDMMTPVELADDLDRAIATLRLITGRAPRGYRAPIWSAGRAPWALDALIAAGFEYDSSFAPVPGLGDGGLPHVPTVLERAGGSILELPPLTGRAGPWRFPVGFALGLRILPLGAVVRAIEKQNAAGRPAVIAFHPWELDPDPPALRLSPALALAHGFGLEKLGARMNELLRNAAFGAVRDVYPQAAYAGGGAQAQGWAS